MARGKSLVSLLDDLRAECRLSLNPAHNAQVRDAQVKHLRRAQEWLWEDFDWPNLRVKRNIPLQAGQRYYSAPADIGIDRITEIAVRYNGRWVPLSPSIGADAYATYDSDTGVRAWPAMRWALYEDDQFEIWPVPDSNANESTLEGMLQITGIRNLRPLVEDSDTCVLDDRLIVAFAVAEVLAGTKAPDAGAKLALANKLYAKLRGKQIPNRRFRMFVGSDRQAVRRGPPPVYYRVEDK